MSGLVRTVIASPARAQAIIEEVAAKHGVNHQALLVARWKRAVVLPKAEIVFRLKRELGWPYQMIGAHLGISVGNAHSLFKEWEKAVDRHKVFLPVNLISREEHDRIVAAHEAATADALAQLAEIVEGVKRAPGLAEQIAQRLDLRLRGAIVLAVVSNVYPRSIRESALFDAYEVARRELDYGVAEVTSDIIRTNIKHLRRTFSDRGWCDPIAVGESTGSRRLTIDGARFLHDRVGSPNRSRIIAAEEMAA